MDENDEKRYVPARGNQYDDDLWHLIYEIWLLNADRNSARTHRILSELFRESGDSETSLIPTVRAIQIRVKKENWREKASEDLAKIAPNLNKDHLTRLFAQTDAALDFYSAMMNGEYDQFKSPGILAAKVAVAKDLLTLRGLGTAAGLSPVAMPAPSAAAIDLTLPTTELSRRVRDRLIESRGEGR